MNTLIGAIPPLLKSDNPSSNTNSTSLEAPLRQIDYPLVRFWTITPYNTFMAAKKDLNENEGVSISKLRGGTRLAQDINVAMLYLEDEMGVSVTGSRARFARNVAYSIWYQLYERDLLPETWSAVRSDVLAQFFAELNSQVPEMRLCAHNWKAMKMATAIYPSWFNKHGRKSDSRIKVESNPTPDETDTAPALNGNYSDSVVESKPSKRSRSVGSLQPSTAKRARNALGDGDLDASERDVLRSRSHNGVRPRLVVSFSPTRICSIH